MPTILYVEDNFSCVEVVKEIFEYLYNDCTLLTSASVERALELLPEDINSITATFIDGQLINSFGWDLAKILKEKGYTNPIIYIGNKSMPSKKTWNFFDGKCDKCNDGFRKVLNDILKK